MNDEIHDEWIEIKGESKADAVERACNALNTNETYLEYVILTRKPFKIRARKRTEEETRKAPEAEKAKDHEERDETSKSAERQEEKKKARSRKGNGRESEDREEEEERDPELASKGEGILKKVVELITDDVRVEIKEDNERVVLNLTGEGTGLLIGKRGQTLEALQHLLNKMLGVDRRKSGQILLDSDDYRERRMESLTSLAQKVASKAKRERRPVSLEPMSALDRRTLHMALVDDSGVSTKSVGEGLNRKVVVYPKRGRGSGGRSRNGARRARGRGDRDDAPRRRKGPKPRQHDSFDVPPEPSMNHLPEEPDAPILGQAEADMAATGSAESEKLPDNEN